MRKLLFRGLLALVGLATVYLALIYGASESGEVVQLVTQDQQGHKTTTRLWVADADDAMWLRADQGSAWYQRLITHDRENPALLIRDEQSIAVFALAEPQRIGWLNQRMAAKYGRSDSLVAVLVGSPEQGIAVRLVAVDGLD